MLLIALMLSITAFAQRSQVSGVVVDSQNEPVIGASVLEIGTQNGVVTDIDGRFSLIVANGA